MSASIDWDNIEQFAGYGRAEAPVVFVGMEEGLADDDLDSELLRRSTFSERVMDIQAAHEGMKGPIRFDPEKAKSQPTWRPMCDFMLRRSGVPEPTLEERRNYQASRLGREDGDTLLLELLPYPHKRSKDWIYSKYGRFSSRRDYKDAIIPRRQTLIRSLISQAPREVVVCYNKGSWSHYEALFPGVKWGDIGQFRRAKLGSTIVLLAPHFVSRQMTPATALRSLYDAISMSDMG